jgi:hypothetical protein
MPTRSAAEIRSSIESNRAEFALSLDRLHKEVARVTDWRSQLERHRNEVMVGAAVVGTLLVLGLRRRKRRRD